MTVTLPPSSAPGAAAHDQRSYRPVKVIAPTRTGMPVLRPYLAEIWSRRPFTWHLARTWLKSQNYDTAAGQLWIVLNPLLMAAVYLMVRRVLRPGNGSDPKGDIDRLIQGVFIFKFFSASLTLGSRSIYMNRQMVLNTAFPRMIFPIASIVQAAVELASTMVVYLLIHWYLGQPFTTALVWLPLYLFTMTIFVLGLALTVAPLTVLYHDAMGMVPYINKCWLFLSPVMYSVAEIPPQYLKYYEWINPALPWFAAYEQMFDGQPPSLKYLWISLAWTVGVSVLGFFYFLTQERKFAARL